MPRVWVVLISATIARATSATATAILTRSVYITSTAVVAVAVVTTATAVVISASVNIAFWLERVKFFFGDRYIKYLITLLDIAPVMGYI